MSHKYFIYTCIFSLLFICKVFPITIRVTVLDSSTSAATELISTAITEEEERFLTNIYGYFDFTPTEVQWSGIIEPIRPGYRYYPESVTILNLNKDTSVTFECVPIFFELSGRVYYNYPNKPDHLQHNAPVQNIAIFMGDSAVDTTDNNGRYSIIVPYGWDGALIPKHASFTFDVLRIPSVNKNISNADIPTLTSFKHVISGYTYVDSQYPIPNVDIMYNGNKIASSEPNGLYSVYIQYGWSGEITAQKSGYIFHDTVKVSNLELSIFMQTLSASVIEIPRFTADSILTDTAYFATTYIEDIGIYNPAGEKDSIHVQSAKEINWVVHDGKLMGIPDSITQDTLTLTLFVNNISYDKMYLIMEILPKDSAPPVSNVITKKPFNSIAHPKQIPLYYMFDLRGRRIAITPLQRKKILSSRKYGKGLYLMKNINNIKDTQKKIISK